ncbi:hypothetical protein B484DRAFT_391199 [Ochromonadaceae sp. CCMP2298]|nr:hypothetical protein B484DRAFT_391199 [Ochromonadaceae sp. CCMP2298]|mmetsp:Transcript_10901/g.24162  ORF Transcript_10901/g.24162 Transcript_10901/m.24162 type:complete len:626 (+) Transcript_10901:42-1919(+)
MIEAVSPGLEAARDLPLDDVVALDIEGQDSNGASAEEVRAAERCVLEDFKPCSKSHLWKLMMSFYERKGVDSWSQGIVPHFITCNTFIAKSYVKVLHGFLRDCYGPNSKMKVDPNEPLYIIELGCGAGKFSFFMLKALEEMRTVCDFPLDKICFVMTDFTEKNFNFWQSHPSLKKYFDSGNLDAAIFDAVEHDSITLWKKGITLSKGSCKNPVVILANYLFDTLYHDIFQIEQGVLKEGLVSTGSKHSEEPDPLDPEIIGRLENQYRYVETDPSYYQSEEGDEKYIRRVLQWYTEYFKDRPGGASILLPIGALRALRRLSFFSGGRALVISGDKGNNNPEQFAGLMDPHIAVHGSFSLMVNYHAVGAWFTNKGGFALHNPQEEASLKCSTFVLSPEDSLDSPSVSDCDATYMGDGLAALDETRAAQFPHLQMAFRDWVDQFGPNDFFVMQKSLKEDLPNPPLRTVVAMLKLGDWDPDVFFKFRDTILTHAPSCGQKLRNDLCRGVPRVWENYYLLDTDKDIAFEIGRFYYGIRDYEKALFFYTESTSGVGEHHVTYHNQGLCHYSLKNLPEALENFKKAFAMCAEYEKARSWIEKVTNELDPNLVQGRYKSLGSPLPALPLPPPE